MDSNDIRKPWAMRVSPNELNIIGRRADKFDLSKPAFIRLMTLHESVDEQVDFLLDQKEQRDINA